MHTCWVSVTGSLTASAKSAHSLSLSMRPLSGSSALYQEHIFLSFANMSVSEMWVIILRVVFGEYPVYMFFYLVYTLFSVNMFTSSNTETSRFLRVVLIALQLSCMCLSSLCYHSRCLSFPGGIYARTITVQPRSGGRTKEMFDIQVYCLGGRTSPR